MIETGMNNSFLFYFPYCLLLGLLFCFPTSISQSDIYTSCGKSKRCFVIPDIACIETQSCTMMTTYRKISDTHYELEIYGEVSQNSYVAMGFSTDNRMGDDSVVQCVRYSDNVNAYNSYNDGHNNIRLKSSLGGFVSNSTSYVGGYVYCMVQQPATYNINSLNFDLNNQAYYLLMATGPSGSDQINRHAKVPVVSESAISLDDVTAIAAGPAESMTLKKLHGSFMVLAWLMAASIGVLMPRYFKKTWVGKQVMRKDLWFVIHQSLMGTTWLLTVAAFVIIFIDVQGWVDVPISDNPHPLIGCITAGLAFIQPFMAALRPLPTSPRRYIFNWAHLFVGYSAHILALTCIFLAVKMDAANLPQDTYWVLTAHVCSYVVAQVLLSLLARKSQGKMDDRNEKGASSRKTILTLYVLIVIGLGIAVIVLIGQS